MLNSGKSLFSILLRVNYRIDYFFTIKTILFLIFSVFTAFSNKRIVKLLNFPQCIVGSILLISSCSAPNSFSDGRYQDILESTDRRDSSSLILYLQDDDSDKRIRAAKGFASFVDSTLFPRLMAAYIREPNAEVRTHLLFAMGQNASVLGMEALQSGIKKLPQDDELLALAIAAGKCRNEAFFLRLAADSKNEEAMVEGLFYLARSRRSLSKPLMDACWKTLRNDDRLSFWAAQALLRGKAITPDSLSVLQNLYQQSTNLANQLSLLPLIAQAGSAGIQLLTDTYNRSGNADYRIRLACLSLPDSSAIPLLLNALSDNNQHVRNRALERLSEFNLLNYLRSLEMAFQREADLFLKVRIAGLLLANHSNPSIKSGYRTQLIAEFRKTNDEYLKGAVLKALGNDVESIGFLEEELFTTPSILLREFAFEALLAIRRSPRFDTYSAWWKGISSQSLADHYQSIFRYAIETADVSMVSLAASFLRESNILQAYDNKQVVNFPDIGFMEKSLNKLVLPRDIEAYGELLKTISHYKNLKEPSSVKAEWNNPIRWELLERIPRNQQVEIRTVKGSIRVELWIEEAPATVAWFVNLVQTGFYHQKRLHRVVPGFVIQDGCPRGDGFGSTPETIRSEFSARNFDEGVLGMASAGPDTESCQWFITHTATPHLNGRYTAFGKVVSGMDVVHALQYGDAIHEMVLVP